MSGGKRLSVAVALALMVAVTPAVLLSARPAAAAVSGSQDPPPDYGNWAKNTTNWPCYATTSYACTTGNYGASTAENSGWPWREYGGSYASYNSYGPHNCTLYAAFRLAENGLPDPGVLGNAKDWANSAAAKGFPVDQNPAVGAIAQWNAGGGGFGHVAYVDSVDPGGAGITITEDNYYVSSGSYLNGGYTARIHLTAGSAPWPANFIHFRDQGGSGSLSDGTFVSYQGNIYRMAGGAPLYINNMAPFGSPTVVALSDAEWASLPQYPADGTTISEADGYGGIFKIAGGAPLYLASCDVGCGTPVGVNEYTVDGLGGYPGGTPHLRPVPADGTTISEADSAGQIFKIAGGAPLYLSGCDVGCGAAVAVNQYTVDGLGGYPGGAAHLNPYPSDGTTIAEGDGVGGIFKVAGGAPLYLNSCDAGCGSPVVVNEYTVDYYGGYPGGTPHLRHVPTDGTTIGEADGFKGIFKIAGGAPMWLSSCTPGCASPVSVNEYTVDTYGAYPGQEPHMRPTPADGVFLDIGGPVYETAGGAPLLVASWSDIGGSKPTVRVDSWDVTNAGNPLAHLNPAPAPGTFLQAESSGQVKGGYRVAGDSAVHVTDCSVLSGCPGAVPVDAWNITNAGTGPSHLRPVPADGTIVEGLPSRAYWKFSSGHRQSVAAESGAVALNDTALAAYPLVAVPVAAPARCNAKLVAGTVVGMAVTADGNGYWIASSTGAVSACGDAPALGSGPAGTAAIASAPKGNGYWLVTRSGTVTAFGTAAYHGGISSSVHLSKPVVAMAADPATGGYWLLGGDGGVFSFDAPFLGSTGNISLNRPAVGLEATADGRGYRFVASDGGIFDYGDAHFYGSTGGITLDKPVVGMADDPATGGYWLDAADGGIFSFHAPFYGSTGNVALAQPCVGMTAMPSGSGYRFVAADGGIFDFRAPFEGSAA